VQFLKERKMKNAAEDKLEALRKDIRNEFQARRKGKTYGVDITKTNEKIRELKCGNSS